MKKSNNIEQRFQAICEKYVFDLHEMGKRSNENIFRWNGFWAEIDRVRELQYTTKFEEFKIITITTDLNDVVSIKITNNTKQIKVNGCFSNESKLD